jgi:uracil-DNA glycosylase
MAEFDLGPVEEPFRTLAAAFPDQQAYPFEDFRVEWGPIFHRGRLDGSARVICIGQDPGQHENVLRRILVGEAGRRVQGFLAKLGITRSYVLINALLYSVYGSNGGKYVDDQPVASYRNKWIDALIGAGNVQAVVTFGQMARKAWEVWKATPAGAASSVAVQHVIHPTQPESAGHNAAEKAQLTQAMLAGWNVALQALRPAITNPDVPIATGLYGSAFSDADKVDIPSFDLPAGIPAWMYDNDGWARRVGETPPEKRGNITMTVPKGIIP